MTFENNTNLDAAIAELREDKPFDKIGVDAHVSEEWAAVRDRSGNTTGEYRPRHRYSTDMNAAMRLVDEMNNTAPSTDEPEFVVMTGLGLHGWRCQVMWDHHDGEACLVDCKAATLPEAIALTWYKHRTGTDWSGKENNE